MSALARHGGLYTRVFSGRIDIGAVESQPQHADFDGDGSVTGFDFLAWQRGFGTMGGALKSQGDANDDGNVNADDLAIWQAQYGNPPPLSAVNSIPEPTTLVLAMLGVASAYCWRRYR